MKFALFFACSSAALAMAGMARADAPRIDTPAAAIEAAQRYLKSRCTPQTPCTFKPEREGNQWRVWVQLTKRKSPNEAPMPYPGGTVILFFDAAGSLIRRLEAD